MKSEYNKIINEAIPHLNFYKIIRIIKDRYDNYHWDRDRSMSELQGIYRVVSRIRKKDKCQKLDTE